MKMIISCLLFAMAPAAWSKNLAIGPYVGHQNSKAHAKGYTLSGDRVIEDNSPGGVFSVDPNYNESFNDSSTTFSNSSVQGVRLNYDLGLVTLRSDLSLARYYSPESREDKVNLGLGVQYAFLTLADFKFYGFTGLGLSRNQVTFKAVEAADSEKNDPYMLLNYDLGLGSSLALTDLIALTVDYKYSDALTHGTAKYRSRNAAIINSQPYNLNSEYKVKHLSETTQELTLGVMFSL